MSPICFSFSFRALSCCVSTKTAAKRFIKGTRAGVTENVGGQRRVTLTAAAVPKHPVASHRPVGMLQERPGRF
jgi:hypothetical protein